MKSWKRGFRYVELKTLGRHQEQLKPRGITKPISVLVSPHAHKTNKLTNTQHNQKQHNIIIIQQCHLLDHKNLSQKMTPLHFLHLVQRMLLLDLSYQKIPTTLQEDRSWTDVENAEDEQAEEVVCHQWPSLVNQTWILWVHPSEQAATAQSIVQHDQTRWSVLRVNEEETAGPRRKYFASHRLKTSLGSFNFSFRMGKERKWG